MRLLYLIKCVLYAAAGIPYNVSIWAVNLAGAGDVYTDVHFTRELSKTLIINL